MKQWILLLAATFPAVLAGAAQADDVPPGVQACEQALASGNYAQAADSAAQALKQGPGNRDTYLCMGRAQGKLGNHAAALSALDEAVRLSSQPPDRMAALILLGNQYKEAKNYARAVETYQQSLMLAEQEKNARFRFISLNLLGESLAGAGDQQGALAHYQQGLTMAANDNERADSNAHVAAAYSALGEHDKAIEHQIKAVLLEERSGDLEHYARANIELGRICLDAKSYRDAEKWLGKFLPVIELNDSPYWEAQAHHLLGKVMMAQGKGAAATEQFALGEALANRIGAQELLLEIKKDAATAKSM